MTGSTIGRCHDNEQTRECSNWKVCLLILISLQTNQDHLRAFQRKEPEANGSSSAGGAEKPEDGSAKKPRIVRSFHQRKSVLDSASETKSSLAADVLAGVS